MIKKLALILLLLGLFGYFIADEGDEAEGEISAKFGYCFLFVVVVCCYKFRQLHS